MSKGLEVSVLSEGWFAILARRKRDLMYANSHSKPNRLVAVFGGAFHDRESPDGIACFEIGKKLAENGYIVINGGNSGIMEYSAAGARAGGGTTIGVTCKNLPEGGSNKFIEHEWALERWDQRLLALVWLSDAYVIMPGSSGTLVELSMVIETQNKGFLTERPVICWKDNWSAVINRIPEAAEIVKYAYTPDDVIKLLKEGV